MRTAPPTSPARSPSARRHSEIRDRNTRVLKGMIAISRAVFPQRRQRRAARQLARAGAVAGGLDFDHGTGHGVGSYLSVHEGPQRISKLGTTPLEPGMILSNEPGYYKPRRLRHPHREPRHRRGAPDRWGRAHDVWL
jgi:Xaa-Pro aminopeptidase